MQGQSAGEGTALSISAVGAHISSFGDIALGVAQSQTPRLSPSPAALHFQLPRAQWVAVCGSEVNFKKDGAKATSSVSNCSTSPPASPHQVDASEPSNLSCSYLPSIPSPPERLQMFPVLRYLVCTQKEPCSARCAAADCCSQLCIPHCLDTACVRATQQAVGLGHLPCVSLLNHHIWPSKNWGLPSPRPAAQFWLGPGGTNHSPGTHVQLRASLCQHVCFSHDFAL